MYYKEEWINGKLCWKSTPNGEWIPFTIGQYKDRVLKLEAELKKLDQTVLERDPVFPDYEYEAFFESEPNESVQIHGWYPIATDRIIDPEKIEHYIETGLLRRITKDKTIAT